MEKNELFDNFDSISLFHISLETVGANGTLIMCKYSYFLVQISKLEKMLNG